MLDETNGFTKLKKKICDETGSLDGAERATAASPRNRNGNSWSSVARRSRTVHVSVLVRDRQQTPLDVRCVCVVRPCCCFPLLIVVPFKRLTTPQIIIIIVDRTSRRLFLVRFNRQSVGRRTGSTIVSARVSTKLNITDLCRKNKKAANSRNGEGVKMRTWAIGSGRY